MPADAPIHDQHCEFWLDQYPDECTCGATRPAASWFKPYQNPEGEERGPTALEQSAPNKKDD